MESLELTADENSTETLNINPEFEQELIDLETTVLDTVDQLEDSITTLVDCEATSEIWSFTLDVPCSYIKTVFASLALMLLMLSFAMMFGVCCSCYISSAIKSSRKRDQLSEFYDDYSGQSYSMDMDMNAEYQSGSRKANYGVQMGVIPASSNVFSAPDDSSSDGESSYSSSG